MNNETAMLSSEIQRNAKKCRKMQRNAEKYREMKRNMKKMLSFCFDSPVLAIEQGELEWDFDPIIAKPAKMITIIIG